MSMHQCDVLIVGSSFTGSLLGWILAKQGLAVTIVDKQRHPRFAIGESTTPTADFLLAHLADRWGLSELRPLAAWGDWQRAYPELRCGKKRGFVYYQHPLEKAHQDDASHSGSYLVAASAKDEWSDTQWLRSDVDAFLAQQAIKAGCCLQEGCEVVRIEHDDADRESAPRWKVHCELFNELDGSLVDRTVYAARFLVDASGGGGFSKVWLGNGDDSDAMRTRTGALWGHFRNVGSMQEHSIHFDADTKSYFNPDDSAQHHVLEEGWYWMLRFQHGVTSVGLVLPTARWQENAMDCQHSSQRWDVWQRILRQYPSIHAMMANAVLVAPEGGLRQASRLSRRMRQACGPGWAALPTSFGFIDPLHSTGIAHGLSGVVRLAERLARKEFALDDGWLAYDTQLRQEIDWIDLLVSLSYAGLPCFGRFRALSSFYFIAAIAFEKQLVQDPEVWSEGYMMSGCRSMREEAEGVYREVKQGKLTDEGKLIESVRRAIQPWNRVGLLEPKTGTRLAHTAPPKYLLTERSDSRLSLPH
jgi:FADH2 O2-dependent halogenase